MDMGNRYSAGEVPDALEPVTDGSTRSFRHRRRAEALLDGRAVRALRREPQDRVQVARSFRAGGRPRARRSFTPPARLPARDAAVRRRRAARGTPPPPHVGREEAAAAVREEAAWLATAGAQHGLQH